MTKLSDSLQTHTPCVSNFPNDIALPTDPITWALDMFAANLSDADMQYRDPTSGGAESPLLYFNQADINSFEKFRQRIHSAQPVHGSLPLIDFCAGDGTVRNNADWAWQIYNAHFGEGLTQRHPMGSYVRSTMWMSCGEHRYDAHCDPFDGYLLHMSGHKRVRVWPLPKKYRQEVVFNHADFEGRMATKPIDFDMAPGQILFIPSGAMHEVISPGKTPSVSVSFHMGSPFPMQTLCMQLNKLLQGGSVSLPGNMKSINKFDMYFFEPSRFNNTKGDLGHGMPKELYNAILAVLISSNVSAQTMHELLSTWWQIGKSHPLYRGPYPERSQEFN
ncbi:JmjC domain-containing protein [Aliiglaciecola litoralis]|uniref:JmjC domain-containing protein n=1 Tax=Aliiglaciecola litoralis TaxID=582857 RepID=A0ABN1LQ43_9ALTE